MGARWPGPGSGRTRTRDSESDYLASDRDTDSPDTGVTAPGAVPPAREAEAPSLTAGFNLNAMITGMGRL
jgi:hypothetical protein